MADPMAVQAVLTALGSVQAEIRTPLGAYVCVCVSAFTRDCTNPHALRIHRVKGNSDLTVRLLRPAQKATCRSYAAYVAV
jgi:hypothetical protein